MYIGMTDVPSADWLKTMLDLYIEVGGEEIERDLHAGVMMSYKTLNGLETKWAAAWPKKEDVAGIFVDDDLVLNVIHYADYEGRDLAESLARVAEYGGPNLNAIQLDMIWPDPETLIAFDESYGLWTILQVGAKALSQIDHDPESLIERLKPYEGSVQDVLLDMSGGTGRPMDASALEPYIYELRARRPDLDIVLAGGLGPDTLHLVEPLLRKFPNLSIDAQSKLRPSGDALDPIDADCAADYLRKAVALFPKV